jgi:methionyl-tRNA formyltransferase
MHVAFLGTPEAAVPTLRALVEAGHDVDIVLTRPDRRRGRGNELSASPVKVAAQSLGLRVAHRLADLEAVPVERGIVVAYGALIPGAVLERTPMLNVHFSLLPRWRGAAPVERAILAGDRETGVSVMTLEVELDTGPVHLERRVDVDDKTLAQLLGELSLVGAAALVEVLGSPTLLDNATVQSGEVTYAQKLTKEDFHVTPALTSEQVLRTVRLGRAFTFVHDRRLLIETAQRSTELGVDVGHVTRRGDAVILGAEDGAVVLGQVRPEGKGSMEATAWWDGARLDDHTTMWA